MEKHTSPQVSESFNIVIEIDGNDPTFTNTIGLAIFATLQADGYQMQPVYAGQRGGMLVVSIITLLTQVEAFVRDNHALLSEGIGDLSGLVGIFGLLVPILRKMAHIHTKLAKAEESMNTLKITIDIGGHSTTVEAPDLEKAEAALVLARGFYSKNPQSAQQPSSIQADVKIHAQVIRPHKKKHKHG